jgi:hypothetical protein
MANSNKNIVITPNIGSTTADPKIQFSGGNTTVNTDISMFVYPSSNGTLSFEGSAGQLFSITNDLSGSLFSVNDVSGIPSLEVFANGLVSVAPFGGNVVFGNTSELILSPGAGIYANASLGTAGHVLHSNGSSVYWAADDDTNTTYDLLNIANTVANEGRIRLKDVNNSNDDVVIVGAGGVTVSSNSTAVLITSVVGDITSVTAGDGLTGGGSSGDVTLHVGAGTGITVTADAVAVNAAYIATITANNATNAFGKTEGNLNVNSASTALTANNSTNLGGTAAASYQLNSTLSANVATLTSNNATNAFGKTEGNLNVNSATTATNSTQLGGVAAASYQLNSTLAANVATMTANNATFINGNTVITVMESLRANRNISGGGVITVDATYNVLWTSRFIVISNGRGATFSTTGFFDITCPTSGTITGVGGATSKTATAAGIPLVSWDALYYILPIGSNNTSVAANFRVANYTADVDIPSNWVLICIRNGDNGVVYFNNGINLLVNQSYNTVIWSSANVPLANNATNAFGKTEGNLNVNSASTALTANNSSFLNTKSEANLNVNSASTALTANNSSFLNTKSEANLNVNSASTALTANNSTNLGGVAAASYQLNSTLAANVATMTANNATNAFGKTEANLNVNNATTATTATNSTQLGGKTEANLNVNNATTATTATNSTQLGGVAAASYVQNTDSRTLSGNINFTAANVFFNAGLTANGDIKIGTASSTETSGVGYQRVFSKSVAAGQLYRLCKYQDVEGTIQLMITVSSETGAHSGTSTYLWQGGYGSLGGVNGWYRLLPLSVGRGHGDGPDTGENSNAWNVLIYGNTITGSPLQYGVAVSVPAGRTGKALIVTVTELKRGMTFTDESSIAVVTSWTIDGTIYSHRNLLVEGNVGIGNTAPAFKLRVDGTTSLAGAVSDITTLAAGNTTVTGFVNATSSVNASSYTVGAAFTANSTVVNAAAYYAGTLLVANSTVSNATHLGGTAASGYQTTAGLSANVATLTSNNATNAFGKTEGNLNVNNATTATNSTQLNSKTEANLNVNNATTAATATNSSQLGGQLPAYYTNATNITTGTLPYAQIPANVINTTAAFTRTGITTFSANVVLGSSALSANSGFGSAGEVLHSNGTATYWATDDQGVTSVSGTGTVSGITLTGTVTTTGSLTLGGTLSASIIDNISDEHRLFNNMGSNHSAITAFDVTNPSYNFGWRFVQGSTNGPGLNGAAQYYSTYVGLGNDYLATGAGSYGMQIAYPRNVNNPYISIRYNENNTLGGWQKISAGFADTANNATNAFGKTEANLNVNNAATATNSSQLGGVAAASYQLNSSLAANVATMTSNNATNAFGKTEANLNVNNATTAATATNSTQLNSKTEANLNVNNATTATTATNSTQLNSKTEGNLNVNNATTAYSKTENNLNVNSAIYLGAAGNFGNSLGVYTGGTINAVSHSVGTNFIANSTAIVGTGYANVTTSVNSALLTVGTNFIANTLGAYHTGTVNAASLTVGTSTVANSLGVYTGIVNAASHTVGTAFIANSTAIVGTGYANVTTSVNSALLTVGTAFTANSTMTNTVSLIVSTNTATIGTGTYFVSNGNVGIANTTPAHKLRVTGDISLSGGVHANGSLGTAGLVLTSNGSVSYWSNGDITARRAIAMSIIFG